ncbi:MAG TPA: transcription termination/antitermination protein NusA [Bacteroidia bacterium]|nr:transcription termination/antitermination protein NusA [Bacteroidia bacterium]
MLDLKAIELFLQEVGESKGLQKDELFDAIEESMAAAYKRQYGDRGQIIRAKLDRETGEVDFFRIKEVVIPEKIISEEEHEAMSKEEYMKAKDEEGKTKFIDERHILLETAVLIKSDAKAGDELIFDLERKDDFGRLAAMSAKQTIRRKMREVEGAYIKKEFGDLEGEIVHGKVLREDNGSYFIDLGKAEGTLPFNEQIKGEVFKTGDNIKAYLLETKGNRGEIELRVSRTHPEFLKKLFEIEVPELREGLVEIKKVVREAGNRAKVSVVSYADGIDAVGTLVGPSGSRTLVVSRELNGEKIDIVEFSEDSAELIKAALSPAEVLEITVDEEEKKAVVVVPKEQISLAIGRGGQNARLVAKLTGFRVDIQTDEEKKEELENEEKSEDGKDGEVEASEKISEEKELKNSDEITEEKVEVVFEEKNNVEGEIVEVKNEVKSEEVKKD